MHALFLLYSPNDVNVSPNTAEREGGPPKYTTLLDEIEQDLAGTVLASFQDPSLWFGNET